MRRITWKGFLAFPVSLAVSFFLIHPQDLSSQSFNRAHDPGVRGGKPAAGGFLAGLTANQQAFFEVGKDDFAEVEEVDEGLGQG